VREGKQQQLPSRINVTWSVILLWYAQTRVVLTAAASSASARECTLFSLPSWRWGGWFHWNCSSCKSSVVYQSQTLWLSCTLASETSPSLKTKVYLLFKNPKPYHVLYGTFAVYVCCRLYPLHIGDNMVQHSDSYLVSVFLPQCLVHQSSSTSPTWRTPRPSLCGTLQVSRTESSLATKFPTASRTRPHQTERASWVPMCFSTWWTPWSEKPTTSSQWQPRPGWDGVKQLASLCWPWSTEVCNRAISIKERTW